MTETLALPKSPISVSTESYSYSIHGKKDEQQPAHSAAKQLGHSDDEQPESLQKDSLCFAYCSSA